MSDWYAYLKGIEIVLSDLTSSRTECKSRSDLDNEVIVQLFGEIILLPHPFVLRFVHATNVRLKVDMAIFVLEN